MDSKRATTIVQNHSRWSGSMGAFFRLMAVRNSSIIFVVIAAALGLIIVACGGGGGGSSGSAPSGSSSGGSTVSGTAATGAPIAFGAVALKNSTGTMLSTTTNASGDFSFYVSGSTPPFLLKISPSTPGSSPYYSFADATGITNITPLTNLVLFEASGRSNLDTLFNSNGFSSFSTAAINFAQDIVRERLSFLLMAYGLNPIITNLLHDPFKADNTKMDALIHNHQIIIDVDGKNVALKTDQGNTLSYETKSVSSVPNGIPVVGYSLANIDGMVKHCKDSKGTDKGCFNYVNKELYTVCPENRKHNSVDLAVPVGTVILATIKGKVVTAHTINDGPNGKYIDISNANFTVRYAHLSQIDVIKGDPVERNIPMGKTGDTGKGTGPHLHYQIWEGSLADHGTPDYCSGKLPLPPIQTFGYAKAAAVNPSGSTLTADSAYCTGSSAGVHLTWTASSNAVNYTVYRNHSPITVPLTVLKFTDSGLPAGPTYIYEIIASNATGQTWSNPFPVSVPANVCGSFSPPSSPPASTINSQLTLGPLSLNFGNVQVGSCNTAYFAVQHVTGTAAASGSVSSGSNPAFSIVSGSSFSASNGSSPLVGVQFCPASAGAFSGSASVSSSATFTSTNTITLTGTGIAPTPSISSISPSIVHGSNSPQSFTIHGSGFNASSTVTLRDIVTGEVFPNRAVSSRSSTHLTINPIFTTVASVWSVEILNGSLSSGELSFPVLVP